MANTAPNTLKARICPTPDTTLCAATALSAAPTKKAAFSAPMAVLLTPICASFTPAEFKNRPKPAKRKNTEKKRE